MINSYQKFIEGKKNSDLEKYFKEFMVVSEKISGTLIYVEKKDGKIFFYKKYFEPITKIDRTLSFLYEFPIEYFTSEKIINKIPKNLILSFEYIFDKKINQIFEYDHLPKNNLILTNILKRDGKKIIPLKNRQFEVKDFAKKLEVDYLDPIISGFLRSSQIKELINELKTPDYNISNIVKILNPTKAKNILTDSIEKPIEGLIFCIGEAQEINFKLIDNYFQIQRNRQIEQDKKRDEILKIVFSDIIEFLQRKRKDWNNYILITEQNFEERYINFFVNLFLEFIVEKKERYKDLKIDTPEIFKNEIFLLNLKEIKTKNLDIILKENENSIHILKMFLMLFKKRKRNKNEFLSEKILIFQNQLTNDIHEFLKHERKNETFVDRNSKEYELLKKFSKSNNLDFITNESIEIFLKNNNQ